MTFGSVSCILDKCASGDNGLGCSGNCSRGAQADLLGQTVPLILAEIAANYKENMHEQINRWIEAPGANEEERGPCGT